MVDKNEITKLASWVLISSYRSRVLITLGGKLKTPSTLARESGVKINHISKVLKELKEKKLVVCINEEAHKGRLYQMTDLGQQVLKEAKRIKEL
ncbi:MAG: transcriptional regulator [Clostridia bacterium]|nr:transcriptional regulator [Clostridia bacterium]